MHGLAGVKLLRVAWRSRSRQHWPAPNRSMTPARNGATVEPKQAHMAPQVVPSAENPDPSEALPVWPAGVCEPMMAALPSGRLLLARIKHIPGPQASPARPQYICLTSRSSSLLAL